MLIMYSTSLMTNNKEISYVDYYTNILQRNYILCNPFDSVINIRNTFTYNQRELCANILQQRLLIIFAELL